MCTRKRPHSAVSELSISSDSSGGNVDVIELSHARVQPIRQALGDLVQLCPRTGNSSQRLLSTTMSDLQPQHSFQLSSQQFLAQLQTHPSAAVCTRPRE